jgi:hypothetical protein
VNQYSRDVTVLWAVCDWPLRKIGQAPISACYSVPISACGRRVRLTGLVGSTPHARALALPIRPGWLIIQGRTHFCEGSEGSDFGVRTHFCVLLKGFAETGTHPRHG